MRAHRDRHRSLQPLPPWITQCLCHQSSSATSVPSCCPCLGRTGQVSVLWKVTCHHHHPLTHHCSSHHGGDRPTPSPGEGSCYASHREVKAARSKFCPQTSSSDQGCVHKNQDSSSQPCPDGTGNTELPVGHRSEIPVELSITSFWPNLFLFQKIACPSFPSTGWGMQRFVQQFITAQLNHSAPLKHLEPMGVRSLHNIRLDLI